MYHVSAGGTIKDAIKPPTKPPVNTKINTVFIMTSSFSERAAELRNLECRADAIRQVNGLGEALMAVVLRSPPDDRSARPLWSSNGSI
jgi:hypothetical protein